MAAKQKNDKCSCPFWSSESSSCMKCKGGLLIPLNDHVEVYCTAPNYPSCLQYSYEAGSQMELVKGGENSLKNRRKFLRLTTSHKITVTKITGTDEAGSQLSALATTLDVSKEGMRFSSPVSFANGAVLQFFIHDSSSEDLKSGVGQVTWCNKYIDGPGYQAGVLFQGKTYIEAMGEYLGLHLGHM